jgi:gas vesicle protein
LTDDTTTNATRYISFTPSTSGSIGALTVSSTKLSFNPSSGRVTATDFFASSDRNLKTDIETIENALTLVNKLRGVTFTWKESGVPGMGVIAQEAEEIIPEVVYEVDGVKSVSYGNLIGLLIESIKELTQEVDYLKQKIDK